MSELQGLTYLVMPCAFRCGEHSRGPGRFGDFDGLTDAIDYMQALGVSTVVTTPPYDAVAYHGYQHGPPESIDPRLGGDAAFDRFVRAAHDAGMRVLIDFVAYGADPRGLSKTERADLAWENAARTRATGYTARTWNGKRVRFSHWNLHAARARERVIQWAQRWLDPDRPDAVDGLRLDHVWERYPADGARRPDGLAAGSPPWAEGWGYHLSGFWAEFAGRIRQARPDATLLAEPAEWHLSGESLLKVFDAVLSKPLLFGMRRSVATGDAGVWHEACSGEVDGLVCCSGDHDVDRLASSVGPGAHKAALALLMLGRAAPLLYAGDELGLPGRRLHRLGGDAGDLGRRGPMRWTRGGGWPDTDHGRRHVRAAAHLDQLARPGLSVEEQENDPESTLRLVRRLGGLRARHLAISLGERTRLASPQGVWGERCRTRDECVDLWVNLTSEKIDGDSSRPALAAWEAVVTERPWA